MSVAGPPEKLNPTPLAVSEISDGLAGQALRKQQDAQVTRARLRVYDSPDDEFKKRRALNLFGGYVLPIVGLLFLTGYFFFGSSGTGAQNDKARTPTVVATVASVGNVFSSSRPAFPSPTIDFRVKCFAREDVRGVYSDTVVYSGGLVVPSRYTRVLEGMIWSDRYGWLPALKFGCNGDLLPIESEFVMPAATRTPTVPRSIVIRTATPTMTILPPSVPTLATGILLFQSSGCDVSWHVLNVRAAFVEYAGKREGVPGDVAGKPVIRSFCPYTGTVKLDVWANDGTRQTR